MVSAQMCRLCTAVTPFTATKLSRTSLYFSPDGVPDVAGQRQGVSLKTTKATWESGGLTFHQDDENVPHDGECGAQDEQGEEKCADGVGHLVFWLNGVQRKPVE